MVKKYFFNIISIPYPSISAIPKQQHKLNQWCAFGGVIICVTNQWQGVWGNMFKNFIFAIPFCDTSSAEITRFTFNRRLLQSF